MRILAWFNIVYGALGLICSMLMVTVLPAQPLTSGVLASGAAASAWVLAVGVVLLVKGPRALAGVREWASRRMRRP